MAQARRAFQEEDETLEITPQPSASPRRGFQKPQRRGVGKLLAPLALSGLVVAGSFALAARGGQSDAIADPSDQDSPLGLSRSNVRSPLPTPSASAKSGESQESEEPLPPLPSAPVADAPSAEPAPTEEPEPSAAEPESEAPPETPAFDPSALGNDSGEMYTASSVNLRTGPGTSYEVRVTLEAGVALTLTDVKVDGWQQVKYKQKAGWVKSEYLSKTKPEAPPASSGGSAGGGSSSGSGVCDNASAKAIESGLTSKSVAALRKVCATFPEVKSYGGYRNESGYHGQGRAIDIMVSGEQGWVIAKWARENASSLGVIEVIHSQQIWTTQRSSEGWRHMSDRGSPTANHYDHVHLSIGS